MKRIHKNEKIMTAVEGGFTLKPAPCDGWLLDGHRFVTDAEVLSINLALTNEIDALHVNGVVP